MAGEIPIVDSDSQKAAMDQFRRHGGMLRMAEAIRAGIHRRTLYALLDAGALEQLSRGLYRLYDAQPLRNPDLVTVALRVPKGVICLISALAFHEMTTQIPHEIYVGVSRDSEPPRMDHPPSEFSGLALPHSRSALKPNPLMGFPFASTAERKPWRTVSNTETRSEWTPPSRRFGSIGGRDGSMPRHSWASRKYVG